MLIVEDDVDALELTATVLTNAGFVVFRAGFRKPHRLVIGTLRLI
jgi:DNA-binding response OmpR family regulator